MKTEKEVRAEIARLEAMATETTGTGRMKYPQYTRVACQVKADGLRWVIGEETFPHH